MELIGQVREREVYYCNIRETTDWSLHLPREPWIAFTIFDNGDRELIDDIVKKCLDTPVCYTCSAGELASLTEDWFDEEIVWREVEQEMKTGIASDYEDTPMTTYHKNFSEGFWFATTLATQIIDEEYVRSNKVVCIDATSKRVRLQLIDLIGKINDGWLPSDEKAERPVYDDDWERCV